MVAPGICHVKAHLVDLIGSSGIENPTSAQPKNLASAPGQTLPPLGLGGLCSKIVPICYAAIPGLKLYHAQVKLYYADTMLTGATYQETNVAMANAGNGSQRWR